jgi:hypothetical protein
MEYVKFKNYDTIGELLDGYSNEYYSSLYIIINNIIVFIYKKSSI